MISYKNACLGESLKEETAPEGIAEKQTRYEISIGTKTNAYGFSNTMTLKFETLAEVKAAESVLADIVLGFGDEGAAIMITKVCANQEDADKGEAQK